MRFRSDNASGLAPCVADKLASIANADGVPYGMDTETARSASLFSEVFGCGLKAFPVATGTAANALALSTIVGPGSAIFCHEHAHINVDEAGAPEFLSGGAKLIALPGAHGKLDAAMLEEVLLPISRHSVHQVEPAVISITQPTEWGACYTPEEIRNISAIAKRFGLKLHMDGARFANAVAHLGCTAAATSWEAGVDLMSFGATKNGALAAEAVIFFSDCAAGFERARKRSGHLLSKGWLIAAQLNAMLDDSNWLKLAAHANAMAAKLATGIAAIKGVELFAPVEANLVFARVPGEDIVMALHEAGAQLLTSEWASGSPVIRLVASHATTPAEVEAFVALLAKIVAQRSAA